MTHSDTQSRVLVVEDEPGLADLYTAWLSDSYDVTTAYNGTQALDFIDDTIEVVLLDRRMPDHSGSVVLAELRQQGYEGRVSMVTAVEPDLDIIEMGFDDYLTKPVTRDEILETVDRLITLETYDYQLGEFYAAASKKATLDTNTSSDILQESNQYGTLETRVANLKEELTETAAGQDSRGQDKPVHTGSAPDVAPTETRTRSARLRRGSPLRMSPIAQLNTVKKPRTTAPSNQFINNN